METSAKLLALFLASGLFSLYVLWLFYLATMALKRVNDKTPLTGIRKFFGLAIYWPGYVLDALVNVVYMTIVFRELPRELLVTDRLSRHKKQGSKLAAWICATLLDPFDPDPSGCHCK